MIHTNRIVTVGEQESIIDRPIVLYRGDREVEIEFTLVGNEFTFSEEGNVIKSVNASHGQLVLNTPSGEHMFSELAECHEGKVVFVVTKEMIDEFIEMGFYSFQIRLYDSAEMKSRVTIPPVFQGFDIRNPIAAEDEVNVTDLGVVDYSRVGKDEWEEELETFDWKGNYNKTDWQHHDVIYTNKLNKIEDALYSINANVKESDVVMLNALDNVKKDADKYVKERMDKVEADVDEFERNLNADVQQFEIDTNAAMTAHKNEVSEVVDGFSVQLAHISNDINFMSVENFGAKGDGVTDDTQAIQNAINSEYPIEFSNKTYIVDNINFNKNKHYAFKRTTIKTVTAGSEVATITSKLHFSGSVTFDANKKKNYALVYENGGRCFFENIECINSLIYGLLCTSNRGGNVNINTFNQLRVTRNGTKETITNYTYVNTTSIIFPKTIFRDTSILTRYVFVIDGTINPVKSVTSDGNNYTITFKETISSTTPKIVLYTGGGLMLEGMDCGIFTFNTIDAISNEGVGVRITSLYGHTFNNLCVQDAYIGVLLGQFGSNSPCQGCVFIKPYFELVEVDDIMVESHDANIVVFQPVRGTCSSLFYPGTKPAKCVIINDGETNIPIENYLGNNPGTRTLRDKHFYYANYSLGYSGSFNITLDYTDICDPKILFFTNATQAVLKFKGVNGILVNGVEEYSLPRNNNEFRVVAVIYNKQAGVWKVKELGESSNVITTNNRPASPNLGQSCFDTTLKKPIWWNGSSWIDATGTSV